MVAIVTANIGRKKTKTARKDAFAKTRRLFPGSTPVAGFQEIDEDDLGNEHAWLRGTYPPTKFGHANIGSRCPIAIPKTWRISGQKLIQTSAGIAKISPARYISEAVITRDYRRLVILNNHTVAGAYTNPGQAKEAARRAAWQTHFQALKDRVRKYVADGETVIVIGDMNRPRMPKVHPDEQRLVGVGLDYIILIQPPPARRTMRIKTGKPRHQRLGIDGHAAHGVRLSISKAKQPKKAKPKRRK